MWAFIQNMHRLMCLQCSAADVEAVDEDGDLFSCSGLLLLKLTLSSDEFVLWLICKHNHMEQHQVMLKCYLENVS